MGTGEGLLTNAALFPLISEANGGGLSWAVLDKSNTHFAMEQLVGQAAQFRQAATVISRLHAMTISGMPKWHGRAVPGGLRFSG